MPLTPEQRRIYREMSPRRKLEQAADFQLSARKLKTAALRSLHPDWIEQQISEEVRKTFLYATS